MGKPPLTRVTAFVLGLVAVVATLTPLRSQAQANAQVVNANVNCRASPPKFGPVTLVSGELNAGEVLMVLTANTRVQVLQKVAIANRDEWYRVRTANGTVCWVYSGLLGRPGYLRLDQGVSLGASNARTAGIEEVLAGFSALLPEARAQATPEGVMVASEPTVTVNTVLLGLVRTVYVFVVVAALICIRRWVFPTSGVLTAVSGLGVLLLLGAVSEPVFGEIIRNLITSGKTA
jgi:hypothetical protein